MKKLLFLLLALAGLLMFAMSGLAGATSPDFTSLTAKSAGADPGGPAPVWAAAPAAAIAPTLSAVAPTAAPNDIDAPITITGAGFTAVMDGTGTVVLTAPTASLGGTALTGVTFVNSTTLTATVPWGLDPGAYALTVVDPDGGTATLAGAVTVTQGIGQWNGGTLYGGSVQRVLMKPGDARHLLPSPATSACSAARTPASTGASSAAMSAAIAISRSIRCTPPGCTPVSRTRSPVRKTKETRGPDSWARRAEAASPTRRCVPRPTTHRSFSLPTAAGTPRPWD